MMVGDGTARIGVFYWLGDEIEVEIRESGAEAGLMLDLDQAQRLARLLEEAIVRLKACALARGEVADDRIAGSAQADRSPAEG